MAAEFEDEVIDTGEGVDSVDESAYFEMSDADLEAAFREAKRSEGTSVTKIDDAENEEEYEESTDGDTEQPTMDSDDNGDTVAETEEVDVVPDDGEATEVEGDKAEVTQEVQKYKYKANGQEFEFTENEIKEQFGTVFAKAVNYTQKMQAMAPYRSIIETVKENNVSQEDLNLMIDVLKGSKDAVAAMLKRTGVDALEVDVEQGDKYVPKNYGRSDTELAIREVVDEIGKDSEYAITHHVVDKQWDDKSREVFLKNPALIKELHLDVKSGVFDKVNAEMLKIKVLDGARKSDIEYYIEAGSKYHMANREREAAEMQRAESLKAEQERKSAESAKLAAVKAEEAKRKETANAEAKRKAAAPTPQGRAGKKDVLDYMDDLSDEAYEKWYKDKIENR